MHQIAGNTLILSALLTTTTASAWDFGDMMNPGRWFDRSYYRGDDDYHRYVPFGYPGIAPYYGIPPYAPPPYMVAPAPAASDHSELIKAKEREIEALKQRLDQLEAAAQANRQQSEHSQDQPPPTLHFRPLDQD